MLREGLYKVSFETPLGKGGGIVYLGNGLIRGADEMMAYVGTYQVENESVSVNFRAFEHTKVPNMVSVFGLTDVQVSGKGTISGDKVNLTATSSEVHGVTLRAELVRFSD